MDCIFCKIASEEVPATILYKDDNVIAFDDMSPQAPLHKIIIPRKHIATINDLTPEDNELVGQMMQAAKHIAHDLKIAESGYRVLMNCNAGAGQTVFHIHLHLMGGRPMLWPPG